jgi:anti-anti-sigma factor
MEVHVAQGQGRVPVTIFRIVGSIHMGNAEQIESQARAAVADGARNVLFDLTAVPSMTSAGLRVLHLLYKLLESADPAKDSNVHNTMLGGSVVKSAHLKLANPSPSLLRVLTIAGFDTFLEIHDSVPDAVASF